MACAASPIERRGAAACQPLARTVPRNPVGMALEFGHAVGHQGARTSGKLARQELLDRLRRAVRLSKLNGPVARQEQSGGEAAVLVRQRDQHVVAARPDVQRLALEPVRPPCGTRRYREFLVAVLEIGASRASIRPCAQSPAHQRARAVGGQQRPHGNLEDEVAAQIADASACRSRNRRPRSDARNAPRPPAAERGIEQHLIEPCREIE